MWKSLTHLLTADSLPLFGSALLLCVMVAAAYTFAVCMSAGATGRVRTLQAARLGAYGTVGLIGCAVLCLAYAFVSHDFRLRYVAHYSDRSMPTPYLLTALWGGQDGSLLWWLFLLSIYIGVCVYYLGDKYRELQPYVIATLMGIVLFFCVLMTFSANPFSTSISGARADGEGLNPLLQNFYMIIHPPSLYVGFVGCSVPFAFAVAALVTGRLGTEWITASRKFTLFSWLFLSIGNTLGMLWAYEELGWGGYWAWDPVENAAFMPWLTASAFLHSVMIQERRGMLKVWNVVLVSITFFMTIFGTFLTRSGAIASVHSFAQSSIGEYFVWFLVFLGAFSFTLIMYRWPELRDLTPTPKLRAAVMATGWTTLLAIVASYWISTKVGGSALTDVTEKMTLGVDAVAAYNQKRTLIKVALFSGLVGLSVFGVVELVFRRMTKGLSLASKRPQIESFFSREGTFVLNNLGLLIFLFFVLAFTTFPMVSEAFWNEKVSVGPLVYNAWIQPVAFVIFFLMGTGTLFGWKKTSDSALRKNFRAPVIAGVSAGILHALIGTRIGYPPVVWAEPLYGGILGKVLQTFNAYTPVLGISLIAYNAAVTIQEFVLLMKSRATSGADKTPRILWLAGIVPGFVHMLLTLPASGRRRYGGYVVHIGIMLMFFGFTGHAWNADKETVLSPGQTHQIDRLTLEYVGPRMEVDNGKRMIFADIRVTEGGKPRGTLSPAKFIYKKMPDSPTTEVAMLHSVRDDLYLVVGNINPQTKTAAIQIHLNSLVGFIWFGCLVLIFGSFVCMWPELVPGESRVWRAARGTAAVASSITMGVILALMPIPAFAQGTSSLHSGTVHIENAKEKDVFSQLRCMCGTCARDLLSTCACGTAEETRERLRTKLNAGMARDAIIAEYAAEFGSESLAVPPNTGVFRSLYIVPIALAAGSIGGAAFLVRRWKEKSQAQGTPKKAAVAARDAYDDRLDEELRDLDG